MDKPAGPTSHDVVARVRKLFGTRTVGHTGTLDPFATGLLVLVLGGATRLARFVEAETKTYRAVARLGVRTDTDDATGEVLETQEPARWPPRDAVEAALAALVGRRLQRPPVYSAKHVGGERSHRLARRGVAVQAEPVAVEVHALELLECAPPAVEFRAVVGPGTYLRALARDLGERLGTGGHLTALRREAVGRFRVEDATPLEALSGAEPPIAPAELVAHLPRVPLAPAEVAGVRHGRTVQRAGGGSGYGALLDGAVLVAVARAVPEGWHPEVVLAGVEGA